MPKSHTSVGQILYLQSEANFYPKNNCGKKARWVICRQLMDPRILVHLEKGWRDIWTAGGEMGMAGSHSYFSNSWCLDQFKSDSGSKTQTPAFSLKFSRWFHCDSLPPASGCFCEGPCLCIGQVFRKSISSSGKQNHHELWDEGCTIEIRPSTIRGRADEAEV